MLHYGKVPHHPPWDTVFLVGGGTSVPADFDFDCVRPHKVAVINDALRKIPRADAFVSIDTQWLENRRDLLDGFKGEKYFGLQYGQKADLPGDVCILDVAPGAVGLSVNASKINVQGNSGYAALNVAFLRGARKIFLLGYDFHNSGKHWFGDYSWQSSLTNDQLYLNWAMAFAPAAQQLLAGGVAVWNVGLESRIPCFPKISYEALWEYV